MLYAALADNPFGIQITTLVAYTGFIFFPLFCNLRSTKGYDLRQKAVREKVLHLLAIHAVFLAIVFVGLTVALWLRPSLPSSWLVERGRKHDSWFSDLLLVMGVVAVAIQVSISRRILRRSVEANQANRPR